MHYFTHKDRASMASRSTAPRFAFVFLLIILALVPFATAFAQEVPDTPILMNPSDGSVENTNTPLLEWSDAAADTYKVVVKDADGIKLFKFKLNSADVCDGFGTCYYSLSNDDLAFTENGDYSWKVVAKNEAGKAKSDTAFFTIDFPGTPELVSPADGDLVQGNVVFQWNEVLAAIRYVLTVKDDASGQKVKQTLDYLVCPGGLCYYQFSIPLAPGSYTWSVSAEQPPIPNKSKSEKRSIVVAID
jgi:hypothetical protein